MNTNFTLQCETCGDKTNVRFGMSNRYEQPVGFTCQGCHLPIDIVIRGTGIDFINRNMYFNITGATEIECEFPFDPETHFVGIHLDFPVSFESYQIGNTPFFQGFARIGQDKMALHESRLNHLNEEIKNIPNFQNILKLYEKKKFKYFKSNIERIFEVKVLSDQPQDINAALYTLISKMMLAYEYPGQSPETVIDFTKITLDISNSYKTQLDLFVRSLIDSHILKNLQLKVLKIYPKILDADLIMRPALFLDFDAEYATNPIAMRVSARDFDTYKDLYKDISEIISNQMVLVAGFNNLLKRGDANKFAQHRTKAGESTEPKTLNEFGGTAFGLKQGFIDDCWYQFLEGSINNQLRNAIAHNSINYDEAKQILTYNTSNNGMVQRQNKTMYFLEFVRCLLVAYREMHRLHHLIKTLFNYYYLEMPSNDYIKSKKPATHR